MEKNEFIKKPATQIKSNMNINKPQDYGESNIFEMLKDINDLKTNNELIGYFKFANFYSLLDPKNKIAFLEVNEKNNKNVKQLTSGMLITFLSSYIFYKRNYPKISQFCLIFGSLPICYFTYKTDQEINYILLEMKDDYFNRVDKFFTEGNNPLVLNPNFLTEDIIDPDLRKYAEFIKLNSFKKSNQNKF